MSFARKPWNKLVDDAAACARGDGNVLLLIQDVKAVRKAPPLLSAQDVRNVIPEGLVKLSKAFCTVSGDSREMMRPALGGAAQSMDRLLVATLPELRHRADIDG